MSLDKIVNTDKTSAYLATLCKTASKELKVYQPTYSVTADDWVHVVECKQCKVIYKLLESACMEKKDGTGHPWSLHLFIRDHAHPITVAKQLELQEQFVKTKQPKNVAMWPTQSGPDEVMKWPKTKMYLLPKAPVLDKQIQKMASDLGITVEELLEKLKKPEPKPEPPKPKIIPEATGRKIR